jgi:2-isopropylmalate synthase
MPEEIEAIVREVARTIPGDHLGIHAHDDTGQAVANSLAAVRGGARQIQGPLNGIGERCGNANLTSLIPTLLLKPFYAERFETGVTREALAGLTQLSRRFDEMLNRVPERQAPYVGSSAFATKAGIHASALAKDTRTYEHISPDLVGNRRRVFVSDQAGRSNLVAELERLRIPFDPKDSRVDSLLAEVKRREAIGYAYEAADASFELLARRFLGSVPTYFEVDSFHVTVERRHNARGELISVSEAVVKLTIGGEKVHNVADGNGPVNALDRAIRKDLGVYQSAISDLELVDYKVRILNGGTEAVTRVLIESVDRDGNHWLTIGVSENIVDASFEALLDALVIKLIKAGVPAAQEAPAPAPVRSAGRR